MIWLAVHLSRMKPYRPLTETPLSVGAYVVTKTRFRVVYLTLTTAFALPLILNLWANFVANSWKRHWPYFAIATALAVAALALASLGASLVLCSVPRRRGSFCGRPGMRPNRPSAWGRSAPASASACAMDFAVASPQRQ